MILHENQLTAEQFCFLQESVGFGRPNMEQIQLALKNSMYRVSVEMDGKIVGMGRIVGDGAKICYLQDIFIHPDYQKQGVGTMVVDKLIEYIYNLKMPNGRLTIGLMAAKGKEEFYKKFGFRIRPNDNEGCGMVLNVDK